MPIINNSLPPAGSSGITTDNARSTTRKAERSEATALPDAVATSPVDELALSEQVEITLKEAEFDQRKVEQLRDAIAKGAYPLDPMKVLDKFIELEKLL